MFSEIPGWGHIGGEEFKKVMMQDVESMILTQYNHCLLYTSCLTLPVYARKAQTG